MIRSERVDFVAVPVADLARADEFYEKTLGLGRNPTTSGEQWVEYETANLTLALSTFGGVVALRVPNVAEARTELEEAGVTFAMESSTRAFATAPRSQIQTATRFSCTAVTRRRRTGTCLRRTSNGQTSLVST